MRGPAVRAARFSVSKFSAGDKGCAPNWNPVQIVRFSQKIFLILLQTIKNNGEIPRFYKKWRNNDFTDETISGVI